MDPPNLFELLPADVATDVVEAAPSVIFDEETKRNDAILAEWDDVSVESNDRESLDSDLGFGENAHNIGGVRKVVKEEEIKYVIPPGSPNINARRRGKRDRYSTSPARKLVRQTDVVCCKHCNRGVIRTTEYIYE